jgi:hypothetical protein
MVKNSANIGWWLKNVVMAVIDFAWLHVCDAVYGMGR